MQSNMESPEEITVELIQQILREVEKNSSIVVLPSLVVTELNEELHAGSCLLRVTATYTRDKDSTQHKLSLIIKVTPNGHAMANEFKYSSMFPREIQMFDEILPRMSALLARTLPDHTDFSARVYYTRKNPSYLIAVEDLGPKGFKAVDRMNGLDLKHCQLALRTLARFHAASVMIHREDESLFTIFDKYFFSEDVVKTRLMELAFRTNKIVRHAVESWPEFGPSWAERLRKRYETLVDDLDTIWNRDDKTFNVLNHGDFGVHNVMFRNSESSGELEAIMLVDFQCCSYNSPALDLHQFLYTSACDEVRANHTDTLLREYHAELTTTLRMLGASEDQIISFPQLLQEFESKMLYGFFYATSVLVFVGISADSGMDIINEILELRADSAKYQSLVTDVYAKSLKRLLPIFSKNKLL